MILLVITFLAFSMILTKSDLINFLGYILFTFISIVAIFLANSFVLTLLSILAAIINGITTIIYIKEYFKE